MATWIVKRVWRVVADDDVGASAAAATADAHREEIIRIEACPHPLVDQLVDREVGFCFDCGAPI